MEKPDLVQVCLTQVQPSQFYLSQTKLQRVEAWLNPGDLTNFEPLPVKQQGETLFFTDGHTRAFAAWRAGLQRVPLCWDEDELDWPLYRACIATCREKGIENISQLAGHILPHREYRLLWNGWCDAQAAQNAQEPVVNSHR